MIPVLEALANQEITRRVLSEALLLRGERQAELFALARKRREQCFPHKEAEVRSVVEVSNICSQQCEYCGMGRPENPKYLMTREAFLEVVRNLYGKGRRVFLLQAGENPTQSFVDHVCDCIRDTKRCFPDATLILCFGNLTVEQYRQLRAAGGDRYILKYETSNAQLYSKVKPRDTLPERVACLEDLLAVGFQVGSGNIVGLPGQTHEDLVDDVLFAGRFALSMVSCSVFIPGEGSKLEGAPTGDADLALNTIALLRILYPDRLIPTTSPLERVRKGGQHLGLMAGANTVTIHDGTPENLKQLFPIYSGRRFTPNAEHIQNIVKLAGLRLAKGSLL